MNRLLIVLFVVFLFPVAQISAQRQTQTEKEGKLITYKCKDEKMATVLRKIERMSDYYKIQFALEDVSPYKVTMNVSNVTLESAVKSALQGTKLKCNVKGRFVQVYLNRPQGGGNVATGVVTDKNHEPLPGVAVRIKETGTGIATDVNGMYTLNVNPGQTLEFSYVGMETREEVFDGLSPLDIVLDDSKGNKLDDVVVTGMFTKPRDSYTGAVSTITSEQLELYRGQNLLQTLKNIDASINIAIDNVNGSNPNNLPKLNIRGTASLPINVQEFNEEVQNTTNTPLIILDGFEISLTKLMDYNDDEIERINILKDAAATAIYGSRGANGVIVVVTKRPVAGKLKINLEAGTTMEVPDLNSYDLLNAKQKLQLEYDAGLYDSDSPTQQLNLRKIYNERLRRVLSGDNTDWISKPVHTGVGQIYKARFEGGSEEFRWGASLSYNDTEGAMKGSSRRTFNGGITLMYSLRNLIFRNYTSISSNKAKESPYGTFSDYAAQQPYNTPYDSDGNIVRYFESFSGTQRVQNPLYDARLNGYDKTNYNSVTNNFSIDWNILSELRFRGLVGIGSTQNTADEFIPAEHSTFTNNSIYSTDEGFLRRGRYNYSTGRTTNYELDLTMAYTKVFGDKHQLYAGINYSLLETDGYTYNFVAEGFSSDNITSIINARQYEQDGKPSGSKTLSRQLGVTGNANYTYDNRYYLDLSYRIDGSSEYGSNKKYAPFWSLGVGWNLHNEKFLFKDNDVVNNLKLRSSIGETGSQLSSNAGAYTSYTYITDNKYMNWVGAQLTGLGNYDLTWQKTTEFDVGLEFGLLNDRIKGSFDFYYKKTSDLLSYMDLPLSTGFASYMANVGEVKNRGFELSLSAYIIRNKERHLNWILSGQMVYNKNWISKLSDAIKEQNEQYMAQSADVSTLFFEGYPQNGIYAVRSLGIDPSTGKEIFLDKNGNQTYTWDAGDKVYLGSAEPLYRGNIGSTVVWKKLTVNCSFSYYWGGYAYNQTLLDKVEVTKSTIQDQNVDSRVLSQRWFNPGDVTFFKGLSNETTHATSRYVMKDKVLSLQSVGVQYRFDTPRLQRAIHCNSLILAVNMNDLLYFSTIKRERGTSYPYARNIQATVKLSF